ncbi:hypothetical protein QBC34DRAFT_499874 [Podospora aff. communis PSN243]|uniref:Uncharacterized protein n=1 Tax=Podospora aff. communis PSN243 TaxID=3040156 RepID=A0AAV9G1I2_9PEZI|nr:hypothetical protein QBC34DRAFT_499874 [Podospora aff. communis PSN243]
MSIVFAVWESIQVIMKLTMQRIFAPIRRHLNGGEGWQAAEPAPLRRSSQIGGCRLPELASVAEMWKTYQDTNNSCETYEVNNFTSKELVADLARPFSQSTGHGFSFTCFKMDGGYRTLIIRQNIPQLAASAQIQKRLRVPFSAVRSCPRYHTDYAVSIVPDAVPGWPEARLFVFTTWKFVGEGDARDIYWSSHMTSGPPRREYGLGYMHLCFESRPMHDYVYNINIEDNQARVALARLTRRDVPPA